MASIRQEILIEAGADHVWDAVRDVGAPHKRLAPRFDDKARRLVWAVVGGRLTHHNASMQVFAEGEGRSRVVWIADLLPNDLAGYVGRLIEQGLGVMKQTLERR